MSTVLRGRGHSIVAPTPPPAARPSQLLDPSPESADPAPPSTEAVEFETLLTKTTIGSQAALSCGWKTSNFVDTTEYWDPPTDTKQASPWDARLAQISTNEEFGP